MAGVRIYNSKHGEYIGNSCEHIEKSGQETNAVREELAFTADPASSLDIAPSNEIIQGLVDYTSEGGGDITLKVKGIRKRFHIKIDPRSLFVRP
jgi:hypothetical protein